MAAWWSKRSCANSLCPDHATTPKGVRPGNAAKCFTLGALPWTFCFSWGGYWSMTQKVNYQSVLKQTLKTTRDLPFTSMSLLTWLSTEELLETLHPLLSCLTWRFRHRTVDTCKDTSPLHQPTWCQQQLLVVIRHSPKNKRARKWPKSYGFQ